MASRGKGARNKGANFERLIAGLFREHGFEARRGFVFYHENDVEGVPGIHIECKAREKMSLYDWIAQSKQATKEGELTTVIHKKNNHEILVTMPFEDWMQMYKEFINGR